MSDTYRITTDPDEATDRDGHDIEWWVSDAEGRDAGWLIPDTRLQAIAVAWDNGSPSQHEALKDWPELYDALIEDNGG